MPKARLFLFLFLIYSFLFQAQDEHMIWNWERQASGRYNPDDGVFVGLLLKDSKKHSRDTNLTTDQKLKVEFAWLSNSWAFAYEGKVNVGEINYFSVKKKTDLLFGIDLKQPNYTRYFYGYGDLSSPESELFLDNNNKFYRIRDQEVGIWARIDIELIEQFIFSTGISMDWIDVSARDHESIFAEIYSEENEIFYDRSYQSVLLGLRYEGEDLKGEIKGKATGALNRNNKDTYLKNQLSGSLTYVRKMNVTNSQHLTFGSRIGMEFNSGQKDLFYDLQLGPEEFLRGYRKMRYTGSSGFYWNTDLRYKLLNIPNSWKNIELGPIAFMDIASLFENDHPDHTHRSFGGGIWLKAENMEPYVISLSKGNIPEQPLILYIRHGFLF